MVIEPKEAQCKQRLTFVHGATVLGTTPSFTRSIAKRCRVWRIDDIHNEGTGLEPLGVHRHRIIFAHAKRRGIDHDFIAMWVGWAGMRDATCFGSNGFRQILSSVFVDIGDSQRSSTRRRDGKCDRSACASSTDQKNVFVRWMVAFPLHAKNTAEAIEYGADPTSVCLATNDVDCTDLTRSRMKFVDNIQHPLLMRHGDQDAGEIVQRSGTLHERGQIIGLDLQWNTNRVCLLFYKESVE